MALRDLFRRKAITASPEVLEAIREGRANLGIGLGVSAQVRGAWKQFQSANYGYMYGHQPAVRKVVDYIATNVAQLGLTLYKRESDTEREEQGDHPAALVMRDPNPWTPGRQFIFDVFADFLVYNNAYALKIQPEAGGRRYLLGIPASSIAVLGTGVSQLAGYQIFRTDGSSFVVQPEEMIHWRGYDASDRRMGLSKLETLRAELAEQAASQAANVDLMESGLQQRGYIKRPIEAADWHTDGGRDRFLEQFKAAMKKADRGYPILEEGMEIAPLGVSPKDAEMLSSRKLFNEEVAQQYGMVHCPPVDEDERRQFYADVLPPLCSAFCDHLRLQLLQNEYAEDSMYFEFNLDEKQRSDDRLRALVSAAGAPILTRNEARSELNLPAQDGDADELVVPLNVTVGGKPSPMVMPIQDPNKPSQDGDHREELPPGPKALLSEAKEEAVVGKLLKFYGRQEQVLKSRQDGGFDSKRWDAELASDLSGVFEDLDGQALEAMAQEINQNTKQALLGTDPAEAFDQLRHDAKQWAHDIDRARVMLVAASLLDAGESG